MSSQLNRSEMHRHHLAELLSIKIGMMLKTFPHEEGNCNNDNFWRRHKGFSSFRRLRLRIYKEQQTE